MAVCLALGMTEGRADLFVANQGDGTIRRVAADGTSAVYASGLSVPVGLAFDSSGNLFVANLGDSTIKEVASDGTVTTFATVTNNIRDLAFDNLGNLFVSDVGGTISKV